MLASVAPARLTYFSTAKATLPVRSNVTATAAQGHKLLQPSECLQELLEVWSSGGKTISRGWSRPQGGHDTDWGP